MEPIFEAVLRGEHAVARALRAAPQAYQTQISREVLVEAIPHQLYAGDIPLHLAAAALKPAVAQLLLESGSDANAKNRRAATPLHYACDARPSSSGIWDPIAQVSVIDILVEHGAALDNADQGGTTPLHRAVRARSPGAVRRLLALGARTDCRLRARGSTPLHLAAQSTGASGTAGTLDSALEIIELLRQYGADFAAVDNDNRSAHDWATIARIAQALSTT
ncbi:MAG: ankyrin repeat domain-containing protein [Pseudomonadota bacterium]